MAVLPQTVFAQQAGLNVTEKDGEIYLNHWYVMVVGVKNEE